MAFVLPNINLRALMNTTFLLLFLFFTTPTSSPPPSFKLTSTTANHQPNKFLCLKSHIPCISKIYVGYLHILYYTCGAYPSLGHTILALLLVALFHLISRGYLSLSPTISSVADVFSSVIPFRSTSREAVGLSNVLSGGLFELYFLYVLIICAVYFHHNGKYRDFDGDKEPVSTPKESPFEKGVNEEEDPSSYYVMFKAMAKHYIVWFSGAISPKTKKTAHPRRKRMLSWLARGVLTSVLWTCIIAKEVAVLFRISPSVLGLTVLAWVNSIWDLIANYVSVGGSGAHIALSGFFIGPIINALAGLGSSLVVSAWSEHPMPFVIPVGPALFEILGFLMAGLVWALVILPKRDMKLDKVLGVGLLAIYSCFLSLRHSQRLGLLQL
ncbi:uncharacterized protein LOC109842881 [Asparagus officinalis]|uniref:uncharacterized protein LOC109842881 n=1 Tax=Asparagus officinalis TaxID=4686 RepID=UPI00098DE47E|nr:uncharacterized protein LOC109842881 [Asparagus officinalis]